MSKEGQDEWVFDSLVGLLRGPVWNVPILTFIEHKSLIFEPDNKEHEDEYKKIFEEYKNLVDFMLGSYMEDIGITPEQFEAACGVASKKIKSQFHQSLFEQVWAADDYEIFKRMMITKNIELQLQALELLQHRNGVLPSSLRPDDPKAAKSKKDLNKKESESEAKVMEEVVNHEAARGNMKSLVDDLGVPPAQDFQLHRLSGSAAGIMSAVTFLGKPEDEVLQAVQRRSLAEHEENLKQMDEESKNMEEALAKSGVEEQKRLERQKHKEQVALSEHYKNTVAISDPTPIMGAGVSSTPPPSEPQEIDPDELKRRTEFLKAQRDKLLAMKREEREKQLAEAERSQQGKSRPKSARAARSSFRRAEASATAAADSDAVARGIDPETLRVRRALAQKLKSEVIGKS